MRKNIAFLFLLLAFSFRGFAQDTIVGVVNRVDAPHFEQNACDSRFAIVSEGETYYVMVDNYWPNPYLEDLVIHYDTIPVGNEIEVVGTVVEMEDGNGEAFKAIDISKNLNSFYHQIIGFFSYRNALFRDPDTVSAAFFWDCYGTNGYYICFSGDLQVGSPTTINGRILVEGKRYLFVGNNDVWTNPNGSPIDVFNLVDALPYDVADLTVCGTLTSDNGLCLSWPREENSYLSVFDGESHFYLTNKGLLKNRYTLYDIRNAFGNNTHVVAGGFVAIHYDLFGVPFNAMEAINLETEEQITLTGMLTDAGFPYLNIGPPIPGVNMSFYSNGHHYIENPLVWDPINNDYYYNTFIVCNDTIHYSDYEEVTATFIPRMIMNNYRNPVFFVTITGINQTTEVKVSCFSDIQVFPNPTDDVIYISGGGQSIKNVDIMDACGHLLLSESCNNGKIVFNRSEIHGLLFLRIVLMNGNVISKKIVVK